MIWTSGEDNPFLSKISYLRGNFESDWGHPSLTFMTKKWEFPRGAFYLSPFLLSINSITSCIRNGVDKSLFVDVFGVSYRSKHMFAIEMQLQLLLNRIEDWADNNAFKFSQSKTVCVHFCRRRGLHPDPYLVLYDNPIPVKKETKFLGMLSLTTAWVPVPGWVCEKFAIDLGLGIDFPSVIWFHSLLTTV